MKTLRILAMLCAAATIFVSCKDDDDYKYELKETVWVADEKEPSLPMYSEQGYNTFGARFNRQYFLSYRSGSQFPCLFSCKGKNLEMTFNGHVGSKEMQLKIVFPCDEPINDWKKLVLLDGKTFDLTDTSVMVTTSYINDYDTKKSVQYTITPHNGSITFKKVNLLKVDGVLREAIVSGVFNFGYEYDGNRYIISSGRFDIGIDEDLLW